MIQNPPIHVEVQQLVHALSLLVHREGTPNAFTLTELHAAGGPSPVRAGMIGSRYLDVLRSALPRFEIYYYRRGEASPGTARDLLAHALPGRFAVRLAPEPEPEPPIHIRPESVTRREETHEEVTYALAHLRELLPEQTAHARSLHLGVQDQSVRARVIAKLHPRAMRVTPLFSAMIAYLLGERGWTDPEILDLNITSDGHLIGLDSNYRHPYITGDIDDLRRNLVGVSRAAELSAEEAEWFLAQVFRRVSGKQTV